MSSNPFVDKISQLNLPALHLLLQDTSLTFVQRALINKQILLLQNYYSQKNLDIKNIPIAPPAPKYNNVPTKKPIGKSNHTKDFSNELFIG